MSKQVMGCSCCEFRDSADRQFTAAKAAKELQAYRKGRLGRTTRLLRDGIVDVGLNHGSILDVGGGVGALTFELLDRGIAEATVADASAAYVNAAREEAVRRGRSESTEIVHGDLLELSDTLPSVNLVALDRVICCYPWYEAMLEEATRHADSGIALSYPRDRWFVRGAMWLENSRRARKTGFRTFVHPPHLMQHVIERAGFELTKRRETVIWSTDIYRRRKNG